MIANPAMRFCPFCAQENPDDERECVHCGKRLPAMRNAPARPTAPPPKPAARPAPPRPAPRPRSIDALAPTLAPTPSSPPAKAPPGKAQPSDNTLKPDVAQRGPNDATLKPLASVKPDAPKPEAKLETKAEPKPEAKTTPKPEAKSAAKQEAPKPVAPTGTLLGIAAQEPAPLAPAPETSRDSARRSTKPLALPDLAPEPKADFDEPTEIGAPSLAVDDGPTRPQARLDEDEEDDLPTTARELPRPRPNERMTTTPAAGVPTRPNIPLPRNPTPSPRTDLASSRHATPAPSELPPPPRVSNEAGAFPQLDIPPTPAMPTLALPPMPPGPKSPSPIEAVKYLLPLGKAIWARKQAQDSIRTLLHADQRLLDNVLRELGQVAREEELPVPALADEMRLMKEHEARKDAAAQAVADAEAAAKKEDDRWNIDRGERHAELARREAEVKIVDEDLRAKAEERRRHDGERQKIDGQIRAAEKRAAAADAKAAKADVTPPEKGGGPNTAANARTEAAEARKEATALIPSRDEAKAAAEALDAPIATLTQKLTDERATLGQKRRELTEANAAHDATLKELEQQKEHSAAERDAAERELTQRFVTAGTILNLNRVEHPRLVPLFARVDELKNGVNAREAAILRLESERRSYDRAAVQKGMITVGIALAIVVLLAIILIVLLAR
jgi:hypothetical protein